MGSKLFITIFIGFFSLYSMAEITVGQWATSCLGGAKKEQTYANNRKVLTNEHFYADSNCHTKSLLFQTLGSVDYNKIEPEHIDFVYEEIYLTAYLQTTVDHFNSKAVCGYTDWSPAEAKNITGLKCAIFNSHIETQIPKAGDFRYGIYKQEVNKLFYGKLSQEKNGATPERRPTEFNKTIEYIFQNSL